MKKFFEIYEGSLPQKYAFLDRDGALIYEPPPEDTKPGDVPYQIDSVEKLQILDGVIDGLKRLIRGGYRLVMVSNQNGIGSDIFPKGAFEKPQNELMRIFEENGIFFEEVFVCPHFPEDECNCRKPKTGLVDEFFKKNNIDLENSFMYGDRDSDGEFAENLGLKFIKAKTNGPFKVDI